MLFPSCRACEDKAIAAGINTPDTFKNVGLLYCGIDPNKANDYAIVFSIKVGAFDAVKVTRTIRVPEICAAGEVRRCS